MLPLHMPPPSLSATVDEEQVMQNPTDTRPVLFPVKTAPVQVIPIHDAADDTEEEEDEDDEDEDEDEDDEEDEEDDTKSLSSVKSIPSFSQSTTPSTSTTKSYAMSSSPPNPEETNTKSRWMETIAQLRRSLTRSITITPKEDTKKFTKKKKPALNSFIPMPPPPKRNIKKRRSEATTQPRFNPETNTYTRDTRSNPDHLRMISAELNMMRSRKLSSPLKPRGFLPRRTDAFVRGTDRKRSLLNNQLDFC